MGLIKNELPILEYDLAREAVIEPNRKQEYSFPRKAVFAFLGTEVERYAKKYQCKPIGKFDSITKTYMIYEVDYKGEKICLCQAPMGAPAAVQIFEYLVGYGVEEIVSPGCCGALEAYEENEFIIPIEAVRDEGTSYHYLPPSRSIYLDQRAIKGIQRALEDKQKKCVLVKTWTTDAFYRETIEMVNHRKAEGCTVVDMECSALAACAQFRHVIFGQIFFTADTLADPNQYDERDWGLASYEEALELAFEAVYNI